MEEDVIRTTVEGEDEYPFNSSPVVVLVSSTAAAAPEKGAALASDEVELLPIVVVIAAPSSGSRCVPISGTNLGHPELLKNNNKASTTSHINETRDTSLSLYCSFSGCLCTGGVKHCTGLQYRIYM